MRIRLDVKPRAWYNEYHSSIRIHDYFSLMVNQFPLLVIRKYDDPHSETNWSTLVIGFLGITLTIVTDKIFMTPINA